MTPAAAIRAAVCCLGIVALTACSGDDETPQAEQSAPVTSVPTEPLVTGTPAQDPAPARPLRAAAVVAGLKAAGYTCGADSTYQVCKDGGPVAVWVLTGTHPRPPVVSLHATGAVTTAHHAIAAGLPKVLGIAHIGGSAQITAWFGKQTGKATASTTIGDWRIGLSAEEGTDQPGVHLTLNDKLCKRNCQAE